MFLGVAICSGADHLIHHADIGIHGDASSSHSHANLNTLTPSAAYISEKLEYLHLFPIFFGLSI